MEIRRDIYLDKLISKKHNKLIKVITGIQRCGKSYLLFNLFRNHLESEGVSNDHIIEMAFDLYEKIYVFKMSVRQDLNLRSRLPARSVLNGVHRTPALSASRMVFDTQ